MSFVIHYSRYSAVLEGYSDANWISDIDQIYATSGYVFTLGGGAVSWRSRKQTIVTKSIMGRLPSKSGGATSRRIHRQLRRALPPPLIDHFDDDFDHHQRLRHRPRSIITTICITNDYSYSRQL
jgi:hypothetical protein